MRKIGQFCLGILGIALGIALIVETVIPPAAWVLTQWANYWLK